MSTLLDKAKAVPTQRPGRVNVSESLHEECELAIALLSGEVAVKQATQALSIESRSNVTVAYRLFKALGDGVKAGIVKISLEPKQ